MNKIVVLQGLPGAGKTTYAKNLVKKGFKRVNKDDLRDMLDTKIYSRKNEKFVCEVRDMIIDLSLINGYDIVVDDTNLSPSHIKRFTTLAAINDAELEIVKIKTNINSCIERDKKRKNPVGEEVIRQMAKKSGWFF